MIRRVLIAVALVLASAGPACGTALADTVPATVEADFAQLQHVRSEVGLLHGVGETAPPDDMIAPLSPRYWRGNFEAYNRVKGFGTRYIVVLSDLWGYPGANWYGRRPPWEDLGAWGAFVRRQARAHPDPTLVWDVWNEPNHPYFWNGTRAEWYETYRAAYRALRSTLGPQATIAGPSVSSFRWNWLVGLLEYCRRADCEVNALSWHELPGTTPGIAAISDHLLRARRELVDNPAYVVLGLRALHLNETVGEGDGLYPGEQLAYLAELEQGRASAAARACWPDPQGDDTCGMKTLDGLLTRDLRPRASWWATQWYARSVPRRVRTVVSGAGLAALATRRGSPRGRAEILLGAYDTHEAPTAPVVTAGVILRHVGRLKGMRHRHRISVHAYRLRDTGAAAARPVSVGTTVLPVTHGVTGTLVRLAPHEALLLRLGPP